MFCKNCGKKIEEIEEFCEYCGTKITKTNFSTNKIKFCPFCREEMDFDRNECPSCKRVLVEKISSNQKYTDNELDFNSQSKESIFSKFINFCKKINYSKFLFNKYIVIFFGVIFYVWIFSGDDSSYNSNNIKVPLPPPSTLTTEDIISLPADVSLANGTILKKSGVFLRGNGELQIKNGTELDAVAKLIRNGTSVLTVYIKANNNYTLLNISDGIYWLAFTQGSDWDSATQKFKRNIEYSVFDETFNFATTERQYTTFEVTLNPVLGGTAKTSNVDPQQFSDY